LFITQKHSDIGGRITPGSLNFDQISVCDIDVENLKSSSVW